MLKKKKPTEGFEKYHDDKANKHEERMVEVGSNDLDEMPVDAYNRAIMKIKQKSGYKYEFF